MRKANPDVVAKAKGDTDSKAEQTDVDINAEANAPKQNSPGDDNGAEAKSEKD